MLVAAVQKFVNRNHSQPLKVSTINEFIILHKNVVVDDKYSVLCGTSVVEGNEIEKFIDSESITAISTLAIEWEEDSDE